MRNNKPLPSYNLRGKFPWKQKLKNQIASTIKNKRFLKKVSKRKESKALEKFNNLPMRKEPKIAVMFNLDLKSCWNSGIIQSIITLRRSEPQRNECTRHCMLTPTKIQTCSSKYNPLLHKITLQKLSTKPYKSSMTPSVVVWKYLSFNSKKSWKKLWPVYFQRRATVKKKYQRKKSKNMRGKRRKKYWEVGLVFRSNKYIFPRVLTTQRKLWVDLSCSWGKNPH